MMTNEALQIMYRDFNKRYFRNRLPKDMVVEYARLAHSFGVTHSYKNRPLYIQLDWPLRTSISQTALTLLHECVHVEDMSSGHGPRFQKRMLKLARDGAFRPWW